MRAAGRGRRAGFAALFLGAFLAAAPAWSQGGPLLLKGLDGGQLDEGRLGRGVVIAVVWASWSPRCRDIVPRVNALVDRWGDQAEVLTVNFQEEPGSVRQFLAGKGLRAAVFLDSGNADFSKRYSVTRVPRLLVFKQGVTVLNVNLPPDPDSLIAQALE